MPMLRETIEALDSTSLERLARLAERWQVSEAEVLRRALSKAEQSDPITPQERVAALHELQRRTAEAGINLEEWQRTMRDARR